VQGAKEANAEPRRLGPQRPTLEHAMPSRATQGGGGEARVGDPVEVLPGARRSAAACDRSIDGVAQAREGARQRCGALPRQRNEPRPSQRQRVRWAKQAGTSVERLDHAQMPVEHQCACPPPKQSLAHPRATVTQAEHDPRARAETYPLPCLSRQLGALRTLPVGPLLRGAQKRREGRWGEALFA
jgi:hypothetical protein